MRPALARLAALAALLAALPGCAFFRGAEAPPAPPAQESAAAPGGAAEKGYTLSIQCQSPEPGLCELFGQASRLAVMNREKGGRAPLETLEQRLRVSLEQDGPDILKSEGFYEGAVTGRLEGAGAGQMKAVVEFVPGPRYRLGRADILADGPLAATPADAQAPPTTLAEAGLAAGGEARAGEVLAAVDKVPGLFRRRGYPRADLTATRYTLDTSNRLLEAEIWVRPRSFERMGRIRNQGAPIVADRYLEAQRTWRVGQPWDEELVEGFLDKLRASGLFQSVDGGPGRLRQADGQRPVWLRLTAAPPRTVGGLVSYNTDFGPGLTGYWEHRNLTGHGDRLRLDMPLWGDMQQFTAAYRYPFFLSSRQDFIANGGMLHQDTDAYKVWSAALAAGIERRINRRWVFSYMLALEGGALTDPGAEKKRFFMYGLPLAATYDNANSLLDPTRGQRVIMQVAPYRGTYKKDFTVARTRLEGQAFLPMFKEKLVLASRAVWGAVFEGGEAQDLPSSLRFYSGGGGSVRGYEYQSVGPRNAKNDPLGGLSLFETNVEARWRVGEGWGLVAFLDGGQVYDTATPTPFSDLLWGAGAGARIYTPIGPVRVDLAVPLERRRDDSAWQAYISVGQNF